MNNQSKNLRDKESHNLKEMNEINEKRKKINKEKLFLAWGEGMHESSNKEESYEEKMHKHHLDKSNDSVHSAYLDLTALSIQASKQHEGRVFVTEKQIVPRDSSRNNKPICKITEFDTLELVSGSHKGKLQHREWFVEVKPATAVLTPPQLVSEIQSTEAHLAFNHRKACRKNKLFNQLKDNLCNIDETPTSPKAKEVESLSLNVKEEDNYKKKKSFVASKLHCSEMLTDNASYKKAGWTVGEKEEECNKETQEKKEVGKRPLLELSLHPSLRHPLLENSLTEKMDKYREMLFVINWSNNIYKKMDVDRYEQPLRCYVGPGNNANLIKNLMKRRFWFEITTDKAQAHFIWTQLQCEFIYEEQLNHSISNCLQNNEFISSLQPSSSFLKFQLSEELKGKDSERKKRENRDKEIKLRGSVDVKKDVLENPEQQILTERQYLLYKKLMKGKKQPFRFADRLRQWKGMKILEIEEKVHNHLPSNGLLGNKKAMFYVLREYYRVLECSELTLKHKPLSLWDVLPLTYHVKRGVHDEEFRHFETEFARRKCAKEINAWVVKPGEFSNRGHGIECTRKIEEVRRIVSRLRGQGKTAIIQSYIAHPMLYHGRKFDLRCFMLMTSVNDCVRGYWYHDGYVRTSSFKWNLEDMGREAHLTNDAVQKGYDEYGKYEAGNKLTLVELQKYFNQCGHPGVLFGSVMPQMKRIATDAIRASSLYIGRKLSEGCMKACGNNFELFGLDFMLDNECKPWLIEINTNPCLETSSPLLERLIPCLVENALRIAIDPLFPPQSIVPPTFKYNIPYNSLHYNKFELVFDHFRDTPEINNLLRRSHLIHTLHDFEEEKELYNEEGTDEDVCI